MVGEEYIEISINDFIIQPLKKLFLSHFENIFESEKFIKVRDAAYEREIIFLPFL